MVDSELKRFAIAVRRQFREDAAACDLDAVLGGVKGVRVRVIAIDGPYAQVEATDEAAAELRRQLGNACVIEELIDGNT